MTEMNTMPDNVPVDLTWEDIEQMAKDVANKALDAEGGFDTILAIGRGGFIPATLMAHHFDMRHIESVTLASYDHDGDQDHIEVIGDWPKLDGRILIVDDLCDTGKTIDHVKERYPDAKVAVLLVKPKGRTRADYYDRERADYYDREYDQSTWLNFPWE